MFFLFNNIMFHSVLIMNSLMKFFLHLLILKTLVLYFMKIHIILDKNFSFSQIFNLFSLLTNERMSLPLLFHFEFFYLAIMHFLFKLLLISFLNFKNFISSFASVLDFLHQFILLVLEHGNSVRK